MSDDDKDTTRSAAETPGAWLAELEAHLWAMEPRRLASLCQLAAGGQLAAHLSVDAAAIEAARRGRPPAIRGGVQTVPLKGVLAPVGGLLGMLFDIPNPLDVFKERLAQALADPEVGAVVVEVDSPGGVVDGIPEAAAALRSMRGSKPIVASVNTLAASAAYWLAAQADEIAVTPSGGAGSIGVYATHRELSGAMAMMGVKNTLISAGKFKTEGNAFEPLSDEARAHIQEDVDHFYSLFTADVAKGRNVTPAAVRDGYGEGRVLNAPAAKAAGLVDRIETTAETVARLSSRSRSGSVTRAEAEAEAAAAAQAEADRAAIEAAEAEAGADDDEQDGTVPSALDEEGQKAYRALCLDLGITPDDAVVGTTTTS